MAYNTISDLTKIGVGVSSKTNPKKTFIQCFTLHAIITMIVSVEIFTFQTVLFTYFCFKLTYCMCE